MVKSTVTQEELKQALKEALVETMLENREMFHEILSEVLDDFFRSQAVLDGEGSRPALRHEVFPVVEGRA